MLVNINYKLYSVRIYYTILKVLSKTMNKYIEKYYNVQILLSYIDSIFLFLCVYAYMPINIKNNQKTRSEYLFCEHAKFWISKLILNNNLKIQNHE